MPYYKEHATVRSRIDNKLREIEFGPQPDSLVPANPFASLAESRFAHANPEKFGGKKGLKEWENATDYASLPEKVKKK